jgi:hypothetical protein
MGSTEYKRGSRAIARGQWQAPLGSSRGKPPDHGQPAAVLALVKNKPLKNELPTGFRPTLEDENGKPLADLALLAKPPRLAMVPWLLIFFISNKARQK